MSKRIWSALAVLTAATVASAKPVTSLSELTSLRSMITVTFNEQHFNDNHSLADAGQPFEKLGLVLPDQVLTSVSSEKGLGGGEAIRSIEIDKTTNSNVQTLSFLFAQKEVGFTVNDKLATKIVVTALDRNGNVLESVTLDGSKTSQFVGFSREKAEIAKVIISAAHQTLADAMNSPTVVDDVTFASPLVIDTMSLTGGAGSQNDLGLLSFAQGASGGMENLVSSPDIGDGSQSGSGNNSSSGSSHGNTFQSAPPSSPGGGLIPTPSLPGTYDPGNGPVPPQTNMMVPEPAALGLLGMLMVPAIVRRRRAAK